MIIIGDFEFFGRYDMLVVVFMERLVAGKIDGPFLGDEGVSLRLDSSRITFQPRPMLPR